MKANIVSLVSKILLIIFVIGVILSGIYILPVLSNDMLDIYPELEYARLPVLIACELLLGLLLIGIGIIMYLIIVFDRGNTFSIRFTKGLMILAGLCIIASVGIMLLLNYMNTVGGPGPLPAIIMVATIIVIWIVAGVIMLIRSMVKKAIIYKDYYDNSQSRGFDSEDRKECTVEA